MNSRDLLFGEAFNDFMVVPPVSMQGIMKSDIYSKDANYVVEIDMPGFKKEDVKIDFEDGYLTVIAKKEEEKEEQKEFIRRERFYGEYRRSYHIGPVEEATIKASFDSGILRLVFPKNEKEEAPRKTINID